MKRLIAGLLVIWTLFCGGGHFELSNKASPLRIGFGSRQI